MGRLSEQNVKVIRRLLDSYKLPNGGNYGFWLQRYAENYVHRTQQSWTMLSPLYLAAGRGWLGLLRLILAYNIEDMDTLGGQTCWTPLLRACCYGEEQFVRELLDAGANPVPEEVVARVDLLMDSLTPGTQQLMNNARSKQGSQASPSTPTRKFVFGASSSRQV